MLMSLYLTFNLVLLIVKQLCDVSFCVRKFLIVLSHQVLNFCTLSAVILCKKFRWIMAQRDNTWVAGRASVPGWPVTPSLCLVQFEIVVLRTNYNSCSLRELHAAAEDHSGSAPRSRCSRTVGYRVCSTLLSVQMEQRAVLTSLMVLSYRLLNLTC